MALPQGSAANGNLAGSGASALESWFKVGDQTPGLTTYQDGYGSRGRYSSDGLIRAMYHAHLRPGCPEVRSSDDQGYWVPAVLV